MWAGFCAVWGRAGPRIVFRLSTTRRMTYISVALSYRSTTGK